MGMFIRMRDQTMLDELSIKIDSMRGESRMSIIKLSALARVQPETVKQLIYTGKGNIISLLRIMDAMNYDIVFVKQKVRQPTALEFDQASERLFKLKKQQLKSKRNERAKATSKREELERIARERDFLSPDDY